MKCKVCEKEFELKKGDRYTAVPGYGFGRIFAVDMYDAIDCPCCGCQNLIQKRYGKENETIYDDTLNESHEIK